MQVGIIGLGVVGLSFASVLGSKGISVIGMDSDFQKIEKISSKKSLFFEPKLESFLKWYCISCAIHFKILKIRSSSKRRERTKLR